MDPVTTGAIISGGASLAGGLLTNASSKKEAQRNRNFQMYMSNTAHQREVKDLVAAGLNPILSATGGASTPQGSQATLENPVQGAISSAIEARQMGQQLKLLEAQTNKTNMETKVMSKTLPEAELKNMIWDKLKQIGASSAKSLNKITPKHSPEWRKP